MLLTANLPKSPSIVTRKPYRSFVTSEDGAMTIFACFLIVMMVFVGGIGADLMRNEFERTRLQAVSDRAVIAATDLDQVLDPEAVVRDYFNKAGLGSYVSSVSVDQGANYRTVTVDATNVSQTQFMGYLGQDTLPLPAIATAEERVPKVEISLVLDISTSMNAGSRLPDLQGAATAFIDTVLADELQATTSVSLVPYGGQVNPGPAMFDHLGSQRLPAAPLDEVLGGIPESQSHGILASDVDAGVGIDPNDTTRYVYPNISSCPEIQTSGFNSASLPPFATYTQTPFFSRWNDTFNGALNVGWCPSDDYAIQYLSNDRDKINDVINSFRLYDGTGTHYAMQWGLALLDPSSSPDLTTLAGPLNIPDEFVGRPAAYSDSETLKYIILMTDGGISVQLRPHDPLNPLNVTEKLDNSRVADRFTSSGANQNFARFNELCDLARTRSPRPIIVYTIAFETRNAGQQSAMENCASSPSHFFATDGANIADTFESIARQINQLRLTQ